MIIFNIILMVLCWGFALLYTPKERKYVSFSWFFIIVFGIITYYISIYYLCGNLISSVNADDFIYGILVSVPLIFMYTFLAIFIKKSIYKKRSIIYPIMLILGVLIFISIFLVGLMSLFVIIFLYFVFCNPLGVMLSIFSIIVATCLGVSQDRDDDFFEDEKSKYISSKEDMDTYEDVDVPISDRNQVVLSVVFISLLIIMIAVFIVFMIK